MSKGADLFGTVFERGEIIFRQGEMGDTMYLVQSGAVEIVRRTAGESTVLALLGPGSSFGEMALLDSRPRTLEALAATRTRLLPFTRASLLERLGKDPSVAMHLLRVFCRRIDEGNRRRSRESTAAKPVGDGPAARPAPAAGAQAPIPRAALDFLADVEESERLPAGSTVFCQGDRGDALYVVLDGRVDLYEESPAGRYLLGTLGPGEILGEMALITDQPRSATVVTTSPTRLLRVARETFLERVAAQPRFGLALLQTLTYRLRSSLDGVPAAAPETRPFPALPIKTQGRIRIGFVALSSCAGCSAVLLEKPAQLTDLLGRASLEYCSLLLDRQELGEVDVCIVEGVVRMEHDLERLREARSRSRFLIAWGTCAVWGGLPALANHYEVEDLLEAAYGGTDDLFSHYLSGQRATDGGVYCDEMAGLLRRAGTADDHVRIDAYVPGCPPPANRLAAILRDMEGLATPVRKMPNICAECARKPGPEAPAEVRIFPAPGTKAEQCLLSQGTLCLGPVSRGGCEAPCTKNGTPCWGCRGPSDVVLQKILQGESFEGAVLTAVARRAKIEKERFEPLARALRIRANTILGFPPRFFVGPEKMQ